MGLAATVWLGAHSPPNVAYWPPKAHLEERINSNFRKIFKCQENQQFRSFRGGYMGLAPTTWVPMGAQAPACHQMISQIHSGGDGKISKKLQVFEFSQVPLNSRNNSNFEALGGPWPGLHGPSSHYVGPHGCSSTPIVTK